MTPRPASAVPESPPVTLRNASPAEYEQRVAELVELFRDVVNSGASLGFVPPVSRRESHQYWMSIGTDLRAGSRRLILALAGERLVGSGQLVFSPWPNSQHRAEIQKLFVDGAMRGRGVGRALLDALHDAARESGRSLVHLNTLHGGTGERFYKELGYLQAGLLPGFIVGPSGASSSLVTLYREIAP